MLVGRVYSPTQHHPQRPTALRLRAIGKRRILNAGLMKESAMSDGPPQVGARFGPYLLKRLIGSGGMGQVYEAEDTAMDRVVALKLISASYARDPEFRRRLQREARIAGRLREPHVVPVHAMGEIDGQLYVDMRLIEGTDLAAVLKDSGVLTAARAVAIVRQVASALDAAHAAGVMHRDVKPANILLTGDDFAYLVDFGIANAATEEKLTQMGAVLGTWSYMAPERFTGDNDKATPRADIYALACVLYEALTGSPPYSGDESACDRRTPERAHPARQFARADPTGVGPRDRTGHGQKPRRPLRQCR
jgi:serine/threonine protein kinase